MMNLQFRKIIRDSEAESCPCMGVVAMKVDIKDMLQSAGLEAEGFYPGKKLVKKYVQHGEHKSHCVVFSWQDNLIRAEIKAGLHGHTLDAKELRHFPVSFQAPTYLEIKTDTDDTGKDEEEGSRGESGGGRKPMIKKPETTVTTMNMFQKMADGAVNTAGTIQKFVIMGKEIAKEAYAQAYENLRVQLAQTKIMTMDLMQGVANIIHKATPGGGLSPRGDETIKYKYDAEKTAPMFGGLTPT
jgi:hypothetical protein